MIFWFNLLDRFVALRSLTRSLFSFTLFLNEEFCKLESSPGECSIGDICCGFNCWTLDDCGDGDDDNCCCWFCCVWMDCIAGGGDGDGDIVILFIGDVCGLDVMATFDICIDLWALLSILVAIFNGEEARKLVLLLIFDDPIDWGDICGELLLLLLFYLFNNH